MKGLPPSPLPPLPNRSVYRCLSIWLSRDVVDPQASLPVLTQTNLVCGSTHQQISISVSRCLGI